MSSTPDAASFVLRDDVDLPAAFDEEVPAGATVLVLLAHEPLDPEPVGVAVVTGSVPALSLRRCWVRPDRAEALSTLVEMVRARATSAGAAVLTFVVPYGDSRLAAVAVGAAVLGEHLEKRLTADVAPPAGFGWRSMTEAELDPWRERQVEAYAEDDLAGCGGDVGLARREARDDFTRLLPDGLQTPDTSLVLLSVHGDTVGHLWVRHRREPGLSFVYDVEIAPEHRGRGWGRAAMVAAEVLSREAGDVRLGLHVFGGNGVARNLYLSLGHGVGRTTYDLLALA